MTDDDKLRDQIRLKEHALVATLARADFLRDQINGLQSLVDPCKVRSVERQRIEDKLAEREVM